MNLHSLRLLRRYFKSKTSEYCTFQMYIAGLPSRILFYHESIRPRSRCIYTKQMKKLFQLFQLIVRIQNLTTSVRPTLHLVGTAAMLAVVADHCTTNVGCFSIMGNRQYGMPESGRCFPDCLRIGGDSDSLPGYMSFMNQHLHGKKWVIYLKKLISCPKSKLHNLPYVKFVRQILNKIGCLKKNYLWHLSTNRCFPPTLFI